MTAAARRHPVSIGDVAEWMYGRLSEQHVLYHRDAVWEIEKRFGTEFTYENERGNPVIHRRVLAAFKKCHHGRANWHKIDNSWNLPR